MRNLPRITAPLVRINYLFSVYPALGVGPNTFLLYLCDNFGDIELLSRVIQLAATPVFCSASKTGFFAWSIFRIMPFAATVGTSFANRKLRMAARNFGPCTFPAGSNSAMKSDSIKHVGGSARDSEPTALLTGVPR